MRGDLLALLLLLLVVSVEPGPAPELRAWSRLKRVLNHLLSLGTAEEKAEGGDDSQDVPGQDYQVLRSFEVREFHGRFKKKSISTNIKWYRVVSQTFSAE